MQPSSPIPTTECATPSNSPSVDSSTLHASSATKPGVTNPSHGSTTESVKTLPTLESTPRASTTESLKTPPTLESTPRASTTESVKTPPTLESTPCTSTKESIKTPPNKSPTLSSCTKTPVTTPGSVPSSVGTRSGESDSELRYISKYLVQVISNATPKSSASTAKRVSGARVLTSAKCAAILEEREQKKKKEIEEKEKRKAEREQKKKEKEDAAKKKAEERARKAEEAAKKRESRAKKRTMLASPASSQAKKRKESAAAAGISATTDPIVPQQAPLILVLLQAQGLGIPHARRRQQHTLAQVRTIQLLTPMYAVFAIAHLRKISWREMDWNGCNVSVGGGYMKSAYVI